MFVPGAPVAADTIRAVARQGELVRAVQLRREGESLLVPLFAGGTLLGAQAGWDPHTNQWWVRGRGVSARGFLDEPLVLVRGQPFLLRHPPRLAGKSAWLSLEALRLLGRHGWDAEVNWDEAGRVLSVLPAAAPGGAAGEAPRELAVPAVPAGRRAVVLDAGHIRRTGIGGARGILEGDAGLRLAQAVAATLLAEELAPILVQDGAAALEPREVAGLANAIPAEVFVGFHASARGDAGIIIWSWNQRDIAGSGLIWEPSEPTGGWARSAQIHEARSAALARSLVDALKAEQVPVHGPLTAPLAALEGLGCPAVIVEVVGFGSPAGAGLASDDAQVERIARAVATAVRAHLEVALPEPSPPPSGTGTNPPGTGGTP